MRTPIDTFLDRTTHEEEFLFDGGAASAAEIVADADGDGLPDAPPESSNYRPAEIEAVACWNCSHFQRTGLGDDNWPVGICHLFEAQAQGEAVCDKFTADSTMKPWSPHQSPSEQIDEPEEYSAESSHLVEVFFSDEEIEFADDTGLVSKAILRTGEWKKTPSSKGVIRKPLKVIRDGISSAKDRIISLQEIVDNFNAGAYPNVPIPLTDEENKDHKNLLRLNTGWVKKLWIKDLPGGVSKLMAGMQFTEPDAREKIRRGTYPDVSSGIFFGIERPDGQRFNSALNHVVITHKPFMDGLGGFQFSDDADDKPETIESLVLADEETDDPTPDWDDRLSDSARREKVQLAVDEQLSLPAAKEGEEGNSYVVKDLMGDRALILSDAGEVEFVAEFSLKDGEVQISPTEDWQLREIEASQEDEQPEEPAVAPEPTVPRNESPLQQARRRRAERVRHNPDGGGVRQMAKIRDKSEVDFSNPEDAEKFAVELSEENDRLGKTNAESELETRIEELKEIGFSEMPGALAYYRDIFLSDDGEVATVLLSHDDDGNETGRKSRTATELIDGFIASIPTDKEGKILLSGQAIDTGNNTPPPAEDDVELSDGEYDNDPEKVQERTAGVATALGVDLGGKEE